MKIAKTVTVFIVPFQKGQENGVMLRALEAWWVGIDARHFEGPQCDRPAQPFAGAHNKKMHKKGPDKSGPSIFKRVLVLLQCDSITTITTRA